MRGGSGLFGVERMDKDIKEHQRKAAEYKAMMAQEKADFEAGQIKNQNIEEEIPDQHIEPSSMSFRDRLKFFRGNTSTKHEEPETQISTGVKLTDEEQEDYED